jgi:hypothetical protein
MGNALSKKTASLLISVLKGQSKNESDKTTDEKIVLHDECGDTLWDEVLAQEENKMPAANKDQKGGSIAAVEKNKD